MAGGVAVSYGCITVILHSVPRYLVALSTYLRRYSVSKSRSPYSSNSVVTRFGFHVVLMDRVYHASGTSLATGLTRKGRSKRKRKKAPGKIRAKSSRDLIGRQTN